MPAQIPISKSLAAYSALSRLLFCAGKWFIAAIQARPRAPLHRLKNNPRKYRHCVFPEASSVRDSFDGRKYKQKSHGCHLSLGLPRDFPNASLFSANSAHLR
jgi:hypothetical protein